MASPAAPPTFHWSGAGEVATHDFNWSNPDNWSEGTAPAPGQTVALVFPALPCVSDFSCRFANNDVRGLTVVSLQVTNPAPDAAGNAGTYAIAGQQIKLAGPVDIEFEASATGSRDTYLYLPLRLITPGSWRVSGGTLRAEDPISGKRLTITRADNAEVYLLGVVRVGRLFLVSDTPRLQSGAVTLGTSVNGLNGHQVKVKDATLQTLGGALGALLVKNDTWYATGLLTLPSARFDAASELVPYDFTSNPDGGDPLPGDHYPAIRASGSVALGGIRVQLRVACDDASPGTHYAFITGSSVTGSISDLAGHAVPDGGPVAGVCENGSLVPTFSVDYTPTSLELTLETIG
jgi:hypothetical protein